MVTAMKYKEKKNHKRITTIEPNSNKKFILSKSHASKIYLERIDEVQVTVATRERKKKEKSKLSRTSRNCIKDGETYANFVTVAT